MIRFPLGGRNFETYSENPFVLGTLAAAYVNGVQSEAIAATPKHFVANEAENGRTKLSVQVDEQTLREIYLLPFQLVLRGAEPWCFMTSYNRVNGTYVADDRRLVTGVLREDWGFKGTVLSDWMGTYSTSACINAGQDVELPGPTKWRGARLLEAVKAGEVAEETINVSITRILELAKRLGRFDDPSEPPERAVEDAERDRFIAEAGAEGMVLLKNDGDVLPIPLAESVALIGHHAWNVVLGGGGSARVDALHAIPVVGGMQALGYDVTLAEGVPIFGAVPLADPENVFAVGKREHCELPVRVEWFNGSVIGEHCAFDEMRPSAEYMIKEKWPEYLDKEYCTRMSFDLVAPSPGEHIFSVISTGHAMCYIDGELVYHRKQETDLKPESFYFFKSKLERRFTFHMLKDRRYSLVLESWSCDPDILDRLNGKMFQGSTLRFHEAIHEEQCKREAVEVAKKAKYAVVCVGNTVRGFRSGHHGFIPRPV